MKAIRNIIIIYLLVLPALSIAQGYGVSSDFYIKKVTKKKEFDNQFWEKQVKKLSRKHSRDSLNPDVLYGLAIAKSRIFDSRDAQESIDLLDRAIAIDSSNAKYFAVRGIIKYDWGVWSEEYTPSDGCEDINKAIDLGLSEKLKQDVAIIGILKHPNCK